MMNNILMHLCCLLLLICADVAIAEPNTASLFQSNASRFLTRLSPNEGLSQSNVVKTVQDADGYIWIATEMGLNRYDGYQVQRISGPNNLFAKASISTLFIDQQNYLWVSTLTSGLYRLNTTTFESEQFFSGRFAATPDELADVGTIYQSNEHILWLGIAGKVFSLDINNKQLTEYLSLPTPNDIIRALLVHDHWLFSATSQGLYRIDLLTKQPVLISHRPPHINSDDSNNTKFLTLDPQLGLVVGTVDGLYVLDQFTQADPEQVKPSQLLADLNIWDMQRYQNQYLLATNKGLFRFNPQTNQATLMFKFSDSKYQITDDNILDIFQDRSGNLWLASKAQGVMIWSPLTERFQNMSAATAIKLSHDNVWSIYQDKQQDIWVGTSNGLNRLSLAEQNVQAYLVNPNGKSIYGDHVIRRIFHDSEHDNFLWLVTSLGLKRFNKDTGELSAPNFSADITNMLIQSPAYSYYVHDNQHILFFNEQGHFLFNQQTGQTNALSEIDKIAPPRLSQAFIGQIGADSNDQLLATSGHLYRYNLKSQQLSLLYKSPNYQPQAYDVVDNWVLDQNNILWLAMVGEGLIGIDYHTLKEKYRFDTSTGLASNGIYALQLDDHQNLWFSSQDGLYRFNLNNLHLEQFTADDGLLANEYNGYAYASLQDKRLVFGSTRGITLLQPKEFLANSQIEQAYHVVLTDYQLFSDRNLQLQLIPTDQINLQYDDYGLKLHFSTLQFLQQQNTRFNVDLTGPAPLHLKQLNKNELLLSKLPVGKYHLSVTAINPLTGALSKPLTLTIRSYNAPWFSTPAKLAYALVLFLLVANYIDRRNNQRKRLEYEHERSQTSTMQMQLALKASGSGIWDYHKRDNLLYEGRVSEQLQQAIEKGISLEQHFKLIHPSQRNNIKQQWQSFIDGKQDTWDVSYQMLADDGRWQWYRDTGAVIKKDEQGLPARVSGTYTNITEVKAKEAQMLIFGEAFSQINDWVLILDSHKNPITANQAFLKAFAQDIENSQAPSLQHFMTLIGEQKFQEFGEIIDNIEAGGIWQGEEVIATTSNEQHPILVKINAIASTDQGISNYVVVISDISAQKDAEEKLRHLAHYDYLTNLPNRKLILEKIDHTIAEFKFTEQKSALFFIDLDKFKQVNDSLGHHAGDELLKYVAETLIDNVKSRDLVARQSGDEFMILIEQFKRLDDLIQLAQRINHCLAKPTKINGHQINISSSIGIAIFPDDADNSAELIRKADLAMIHAKQLGRSQFQFFTSEMNAQAHRRLELETELVHAYQANQFVNYYQPIVDCNRQAVVGFEMLMRWPHADGMISPMEFIPIAEETGMICQLTDAALEQALTDYVLLQQQHPNCYISVNLSAIHILQHGLCDTLQHLLHKHQLPASVLRFEITEGTLLVDKKTALKRLLELKQLGFKLLLDDFGTGYSSLTYLSQFPIDVLKIDQSFVRNLQSNPANKPIVKSIVSLTHSLALDCVTEGIEDIDQLNYIRDLGCYQIQGYYFSKPIPLAEVLDENFRITIAQKFQHKADVII